MPFFDQCVFCGGDLFCRDVEVQLRGGDHTATITVPAEVCLRCGHHLYDGPTALRLEEIRGKLAAGDTAEFQSLGRHFQVVNSDFPLTGNAARPNPPPFGRGKVVIPGKETAAAEPAGG